MGERINQANTRDFLNSNKVKEVSKPERIPLEPSVVFFFSTYFSLKKVSMARKKQVRISSGINKQITWF